MGLSGIQWSLIETVLLKEYITINSWSPQQIRQSILCFAKLDPSYN